MKNGSKEAQGAATGGKLTSFNPPFTPLFNHPLSAYAITRRPLIQSPASPLSNHPPPPYQITRHPLEKVISQGLSMPSSFLLLRVRISVGGGDGQRGGAYLAVVMATARFFMGGGIFPAALPNRQMILSVDAADIVTFQQRCQMREKKGGGASTAAILPPAILFFIQNNLFSTLFFMEQRIKFIPNN